MESAFRATSGTLADRMYAALLAGDAKGGDSRGRQSASLQVWKTKAGYGGGDDRAIDIRVDDHPEPFKELGRLLEYSQMNYAWNEAWTLFMEKKAKEALPHMERAVRLAPRNAEAHYDLAVIRLAAGNRDGARESLDEALALNPKLKAQAEKDADLADLRIKN
jgi:tetratricopeptide (TPR) repeat protein